MPARFVPAFAGRRFARPTLTVMAYRLYRRRSFCYDPRHDRAFGMWLERKARVCRTTPPPESVVAGWYENASLLDSYSIDLSSSKQYSMRALATRTVGDQPAWIKALVAVRDAIR